MGPGTYRSTADDAWRWVLANVRRDDRGPWLAETPAQRERPESSLGMHSGLGGVAHALAELRLSRDLTEGESALADEIAAAVTVAVPEQTECDWFDGLVSSSDVLLALHAPGAEHVVRRLLELADADGWPSAWLGPPRAVAGARCNDATLGTAGVLLGAVWAVRHDVDGARELAEHAAGVLLQEREPADGGWTWPFVPRRYLLEDEVAMPNWSHGVAGVVGALAAAGAALDRPDLVEAAQLGAEHLVRVGSTADGGLRVARRIPAGPPLEEFTYTWCHGPAGTSRAFAALAHAGVPEVAGRTPADWEQACLHSLLVSGIPDRLRPGFWDNDGRCCGTAGVGDIVLDAWRRTGVQEHLVFADRLAQALVERAIPVDDGVCWRFVEHTAAEPLLPPGTGWMQGAVGIAAYLWRVARVLESGRGADAVARSDSWWAVDPQ